MPPSQQLVLPLSSPPEPTLENYFPGANQAVLAALHELVADAPREPVLYFWGPRGCGRTHLIHATLAAARARGLAVVAPDDDSGPPPSASSIMVVDDAGTLGPDTQRALVERFIAVRQAGGRFVATGDRPAADLVLREDLRTRIASGVTFELRPLTDEERLAALHAHATARGMRPGDELLEYIARRVTRDMGTQVAILEALDRYSLERKRPLTLPLVREVLQDRDA